MNSVLKMFWSIGKLGKAMHRDKRGITGLETAIILIAFVVVASVFAYTVLSAGIFSSERGKEAIHAGLEEARSSLEPRGSSLAYDDQDIYNNAGDTVVAVLAAVIRSGSDCRRAARLANIAASVTVRKIGTTGTAAPDEIRRIGADPPYICLPELADEPALARYLNGTAIETVCELPSPLEIRHAVFDHDGTISTLRQGWQGVMESVMVRAILGEGADEVSDAPRQRVTEQVRTFIDRTTGVQTLAQMEGLVTLVRQFGRVPGEAVLDAHGYKRLYDAQILAVVRERIARLRSGQVAPSDFVVAGAQEFLESLHGRGVKLYLVSGTDTPEVRAEAETLGYAHLFEGRIYGAVGKAEVEPKRLVLQDVLREHRPSASQVVVFGDGPVEMREARRRGALPVGVASDEIKRQGLNAAKRSRLIRAGADLIIPDFIQREPLLRLLGLGG